MHSILFHIGPVPIRAYGLMLGIGLVLGLLRSLKAARRQGVNQEHVLDLVFYSLIAGVLMAHVASVLLELPYYAAHPREIFSLTSGLRGLSFHGGFIGALGAVLIYTRRKRLNFMSMVDLLTPALALAYGITRIGCFLNGCCYGVPTSLPWGVRFYADGVPGALTPPSHPTQLYSFAISLVIFAILVSIEKRRKFVGQVFYSYLALYSIYRFLIEFLRRGVTAEVAYGGLTQAQWVSVLMLIVGAVLLWRGSRRAQPSPETQTSGNGLRTKVGKSQGV